MTQHRQAKSNKAFQHKSNVIRRFEGSTRKDYRKQEQLCISGSRSVTTNGSASPQAQKQGRRQARSPTERIHTVNHISTCGQEGDAVRPGPAAGHRSSSQGKLTLGAHLAFLRTSLDVRCSLRNIYAWFEWIKYGGLTWVDSERVVSAASHII